jgi:hypothetical protein
MTLNVTAGPGIAAYESTRYTASVNASPAWVVGQTHNMTVQSPHWAGGAAVEISWVKFNANETTTVSITKISGAINSAVVYPKNVATQVIVGGILILTVPTNTRLHIEVDNDRANAILVFSQPTARAIPAGAVYWDDVGVKSVAINTGTDVLTSVAHGLSNNQRVGFRSDGTYPTATGGDIAPHTHYYVRDVTTDTFKLARTSGGAAIDLTGAGTGARTVYITAWTNTTNALVFPDSSLIGGAWHCGRLFELADNVRVVVDAEAVLVGGFDLRGRNGVSIFGQGLMLGTYATHAQLFTIADFPTFASQLPYCMFLGFDGTSNRWDNEVQGITISSLPFFCNFEGVSDWVNVQCINPWFYGTLTPQLSSQSDLFPVGQMTNCYSYSGDDVLTLGEQVSGYFAIVQGSFLVTANNSCLHFGYWSQPDAGTGCFVGQCELMHLGIADNGPGSTTFPSYGGNSVLKCWTDGFEGEDYYGRFDVRVENCRVWGTHASRLITLLNKPYPYTYYDDESRDQKGQAARFNFDGITVESVPGQMSAIEGLDWLNTPHSIAFLGVTFAGVPLTASNFETYFTRNVYPYFITVEGQPVVTAVELCNRALAYIGESPFITSIAPPDESREAKLCAKFYSAAFNEVVQGHEWGFATKRAALVEVADAGNDTWLYCYVLPAGLLQVLEVAPEGAPDGYTDATGDKVRYRVELGTQTTKRLWTNLPDAWIRYTVYVTNPNDLDPFAQEAVVLKLAAKLASAIMQGKEGQGAMAQYLQLAQMHINQARINDGNQRVIKPQQNVVWNAGREG